MDSAVFDQSSLLLFAIVICRCHLLVMIQECNAVFGLIKGRKVAFGLIDKDNLEKKPYVWLIMIGKTLEDQL